MKYKENGQILILSIIVLAIVLVNTLLIVSGAVIFFRNSNYSLQTAQALSLAEAGVDKAIASLNTTGGGYSGENETFLGAGSYSVTVTSKDAATLIIRSTGYIPNKTSPKAKRTVESLATTGTGISFVYGLMIGNGGISMGNGSEIHGSIYSNGNISGWTNELITGDVFVAGGTQPTADQQNTCTELNCADLFFGKNVAGNEVLDVAQSFKPSSNAAINKVSLKLKKVGSPANPTIRIMADKSGRPDEDHILTSGILSANLVTGSYGFVDVTFSSAPTLSADTTYWIMVAAQSIDNSNYWAWSEDTLSSYTRGFAAWSDNWQDRTPIWNYINTGDLEFKTWMGGVATFINMANGSVVRGNVHANTISGFTINKDAYYQTISNTIVNGSSHPGSDDPPPAPMPISDANIAEWQSNAQNRGIISSTDLNGCPATLGPGKIVGNVTTSNNCTITVITPIWITGNLTFGNYAIFKMDPSLGSSSGAIIVGGKTIFQNSDNLLGTGASNSYLTLLSTYDSEGLGGDAINTGNSSITGILYAPHGTISLANNAEFKEAVAQQINMGSGTILTYDSGLISTFFSADPEHSGSYSLVKGTYQIK